LGSCLWENGSSELFQGSKPPDTTPHHRLIPMLFQGGRLARLIPMLFQGVSFPAPLHPNSGSRGVAPGSPPPPLLYFILNSPVLYQSYPEQ